MEPPKASELRTTLWVERKSQDPDDKNDFTTDGGDLLWDRFAVLQCKITEKPGTEQIVHSGTKSVVRYDVISRYRLGIMASDRLYDPAADVYYQMESVTNVGNRDRWTHIVAVRSDGSS